MTVTCTTDSLLTKYLLTILMSLSVLCTSCATADEKERQPEKPSPESSTLPKTFDRQIAQKLGVKNIAYLLAVDINGEVVPFVPDDPKASFRLIDPKREKLIMELHDIEPLSIIAGRRNPQCVLFVGGSGRRLWMESCP